MRFAVAPPQQRDRSGLLAIAVTAFLSSLFTVIITSALLSEDCPAPGNLPARSNQLRIHPRETDGSSLAAGTECPLCAACPAMSCPACPECPACQACPPREQQQQQPFPEHMYAEGGLNTPCPNDCHSSAGWGTCQDGRCMCSLGQGGPACGFNLTTMYGNLSLYGSLKQSSDFKPLDLQGWSAVPAETYEKFLAKANAVTVIEVGVWKGLSASIIAKWLKGKNRGLLLAVDTWLGSAEPHYWSASAMRQNVDNLERRHGYPTVFYTFLSNMVHEGLEGLVVPLPEPSKVATMILRNHKILADLVHIDASHEYGSCREDIHLWWRFVRFGGYMMGDDYMDYFPGVQKAAREFATECELTLEVDGNKWVVQKPAREVYREKRHLPAYCHEGAVDHYEGPYAGGWQR